MYASITCQNPVQIFLIFFMQYTWPKAGIVEGIERTSLGRVQFILLLSLFITYVSHYEVNLILIYNVFLLKQLGYKPRAHTDMGQTYTEYIYFVLQNLYPIVINKLCV